MSESDVKEQAGFGKEKTGSDDRNTPFSAADVLGEMSDMRDKKAAEQAEKAELAKKEQDALREAFMAREIHPDVWSRIRARVRTAVKDGENEVKVMEFPSDWCEDGGRAINNGLDNWPDTLTGFARRAYEFWEKELKSRGFTTRAEIISYPDGMPGDVGLFLGWGEGGDEN